MYSKGKFCITLELEIETTAYKITYMTDECILYKSGNQFISGRAGVTEFFENLIPFELFLNLTYISSTITFPFFTATPKEQKQFIELVFADLNKFKESIPKLKERLAEEVKTKASIDTQKEIYEQRTSIVPGDYQEVIELPVLEDLSTDLHNIKSRKTQLENIKKEINQIKLTLDKPLKEVQEPQEPLEDLQERLGKGKGLISAVTVEITKLEGVSKDSVCGVCGGEIDIATNKKLLQEKTQYLATLNGTLQTVKTDIKEAKAQQADYEKYLRKQEERRELKDKLHSMSYDESEYNGLLAQQAKLEQAQDQQSLELKEAQAQREKAIANNTKVDYDTATKIEAEAKVWALAQEQQYAEETTTNIKLLIEICDKVIVGKQIPKRLEILERFINVELANFTSQ